MDKSSDIRHAARAFWRDLKIWCEAMRDHGVDASDYAVLGRIQAIELAIPRPQSDILSTLSRLTDVLIQLQSLSPYDDLGVSLLARGSGLVHDVSSVKAETQTGTYEKRFEALSMRLYAMHRFLDGVSGGEDFGHTTPLAGGDLEYGLGLRLGNGRLHEFFMHIKQATGDRATSYFRQFFDDETEALLSSLESDATEFTQYMQSHMILRYNPVFSRSCCELSTPMQSHLDRLGTDPLARRTQIGIVSGARFSGARQYALETGVQSLRGFAMLFDLGQRVSPESVERMIAHSSESEKCLSLADSVISRLHGMHAQHWQTRLESVFRGQGAVGGRYYEEHRFFGGHAADLRWDDADFCPTVEGVSPRPKAGCYYIVCRGDRLRRLMSEAYGTSRDYRIVLRQNPQILQPENLTPGMRIYFPPPGNHSNEGQIPSNLLQNPAKRGVLDAYGEDFGGENAGGNASNDGMHDRDEKDPPLANVALDVSVALSEQIAYRIADRFEIELLGEVIDNLSCMRSDQIDALCEGLNKLQKTQLIRTVCVENDGNVCILCDRVVLFVSVDENIDRFVSSTLSTPSFLASEAQIIKQAKSAFLSWGRNLAAHIRGDVILSGDRSLPLARLSGQKNRRAWVSSALHRIDSAQSESVRFVMHGRERKVDICDAHGMRVVQLLSEDFGAMRTQPWRRLIDYYAPPIVQMNALMQVWLGDLFGQPVEIGVPPLSHINQYAIAQNPGRIVFHVPMGTPVYPIMRGRVIGIGDMPVLGKYIVIAHHDGLYSCYGSLSTAFVGIDMHVEAETTIGRSGCVGDDLNPKLCLEMIAFQGNRESFNTWYAAKSRAHTDDDCKNMPMGKQLDYFDIVYNTWPREPRFDGVIKAE